MHVRTSKLDIVKVGEVLVARSDIDVQVVRYAFLR